MSSIHAHPVPIYGQYFRLYFALRLNTGGLNSGAAGLDSELSKDGAAFTDCIYEATEVPNSSGIYFLDFHASETNCNCMSVLVKSTTPGAITKEFFLYPLQDGDLRADTVMINSKWTAASHAANLFANAITELSVDDSTFAPTTTAFETNAVVERADDHFKGRACVFASGTLIGQVCAVTGSTTSNGKIKLTVTALTAPPPNGILFYLL
jgi:hypothetical protein